MKKIYFFIVMFFTAIAVNATTIKGDVYKWDSSANSGILADEQIEADVTLQDGVVTFSSFLNSGIEFIATVYNDGSVTDNQVTGTLAGNFNLGSFGNYESLYLYAGSCSYPDFTYSVEDGVKTLHFGAYAYVTVDAVTTSDWYDIYFYLPDDFEPLDPYASKKTFQLPVTFGGNTIEYRAYVEDNTLNIIGLFGMSGVTTYQFDKKGNITSSIKRASWYSGSYNDNGTSNTYVYIYGTQYLEYDLASGTVTDYAWLYESNWGDDFSFQLPESIAEAALATTIDVNVAQWDAKNRTAVYADSLITTNALIYDGVVVFPNFLGSDNKITTVIYNTGKVTDGMESGTLAGNYNLASFGAAESLYLYAGSWNYDDFSYTETDSTKTLHFGAYAYATVDSVTTSTWYDIYFTLPEDFQAKDPYADKNTFQLAVTFTPDSAEGEEASEPVSLEYRAFVEDNALNIIGLFGMSDVTTYQLSEDGSIISSIQRANWYSSSYDDNGTTNTYVYIYGNQHLTLNLASGNVSDYVWLYESNRGGDFSFQLPESIIENTYGEKTLLNVDIAKWENRKAVYADSTITEVAFIKDNTVLFPQFLGSNNSITAVIYYTGKVTDGMEAGILKGNYSLGSYGTADSLYLYAGSWDYDDFTYTETDSLKTLHFGTYAYSTPDSATISTWYDIYFYLPEDFVAGDPYADKETFQLAVTFVPDSAEGEEASEPVSLEYRAFVEDDMLNVIGLFGSKSLSTYKVVAADSVTAAITSNLNGWIAADYEYNGTSNTYIYSYGTKYLSYDEETNAVSDYIWFYESNWGGYYSFTLPQSIQDVYTDIANTAAESLNANGAIEYYNLQGVRIAAPQKGIVILRQGNKVQKILIK